MRGELNSSCSFNTQDRFHILRRIQHQHKKREKKIMLESWADTFCTSTLCFGALGATSPDATATEFYHQPATSKPKSAVVDSKDDASSYSPYQRDESSWHPVYSPSKVPSVIRMDSLIAPSTPMRDCESTERQQPSAPIKHMLPSSKERIAELTSTPPSHFRQPQWETYPTSPSLLLKKANPVFLKDYDESTDDETVSTEATELSYALSMSDSADEESSTIEKRLVWRKTKNSKRSLSTTKLNWNDAIVEDTTQGFRIQGAPKLTWNDAVVEDTTEGIRIHGPPELLRAPVLEKEEDWVFETPKRQKKQQNNKFQLRLRTSNKAPSPPYLPRLD